MQPRLGLAMLALVVIAAGTDHGQPLRIGIIDFYGLGTVSPENVRAALTFKEGDTLTITDGERPDVLRASEQRLTKLPGLVSETITLTCCDSSGAIVWVGEISAEDVGEYCSR